MGGAPEWAITVVQPWAWAIIYGRKNVENRTQIWTWRRAIGSRVAIHAGMRWSERGATDQRVLRAAWQAQGVTSEPPPNFTHVGVGGSQFKFGAIIGTVTVVDVHSESPDCEPAVCRPWGEKSYVEAGGRKRIDIVHLVLEAPKAVRPEPARGRQGLWRFPPQMTLESA